MGQPTINVFAIVKPDGVVYDVTLYPRGVQENRFHKPPRYFERQILRRYLLEEVPTLKKVSDMTPWRVILEGLVEVEKRQHPKSPIHVVDMPNGGVRLSDESNEYYRPLDDDEKQDFGLESKVH